MIVTCPQCATRYHLDPEALGSAGRRVRCASCGHRWLVRPPADVPTVLSPAAEPSPAPVGGGPPKRVLSRPERRRSAGSASLVGWLVGVLIVLILASAIIGRNEIVAGFPASANLYRTLGLPVNVQLGLEFANVTSRRFSERDLSILVIEGEIVNISDHERPVPRVKITLLDEGGRPLQHELFEAEQGALAAAGTTGFSARLVNPAEQARNFSVTFDLGS
jgi:predicted Zn finger-like uncharacterized protein